MKNIKSPQWLCLATVALGIGCGSSGVEQRASDDSVAESVLYNLPPMYPPGCRAGLSNGVDFVRVPGTAVAKITYAECPPDSTSAPSFADAIYSDHDEVFGPYLQFVDTCYANSGTTFYDHLKGRFAWAFADEAIYLADGDDLHDTQTLFEYLFEARRDVFDAWQADPQCTGLNLTQYVQANYPDIYAEVHADNADIASRRILSDFDGDGQADYATFENGATWNIRQSATATPMMVSLGTANSRLVPGDYDGDGRTDAAVFDDTTGTWDWQSSATGALISATFGQAGDIPVANDYDGDNKTDLAVWRPSNGTWYVLTSSDQSTRSYEWGTQGDAPVSGDYDGDGLADYAVFRPSQNRWWIVLSSTGGVSDVDLGDSSSGDRTAPGDYDNDGMTDEAVFNTITGDWTIRYSSTGTVATPHWGTAGDVPTPTDFDGDSQTDLAVWRPSTAQWFHINSSNNGTSGPPWGATSGVPVASAFLY